MTGASDLRRLRQEAGLSARELARRAGTSHGTLLAYEAGRKVPRSDTRDRIVRAAGYVQPQPGPRRVMVNKRGTARGVELADVLALANAFPPPPRRPLDAPVLPPRIGA